MYFEEQVEFYIHKLNYVLSIVSLDYEFFVVYWLFKLYIGIVDSELIVKAFPKITYGTAQRQLDACTRVAR